MRIVVTGATGFLGSRLVASLVSAGHQVAVLKRRASPLGRLAPLAHALDLYEIEDGLAAPFAAATDAVVHLATSYGRAGQSAAEVFEVNAGLALRVLEAAATAAVPQFINTDTALDKFLNPYALAKRQFAEWGRWMAGQGRIGFVNLRLEHFYGPGDDDSKFVSYVVRQLLAGAEELALTSGEQLRDFIHVDDVVTALRTVLDQPGASPAFTEYDVGSGAPVSIRALVELIHQGTGARTALRFGAVPYRQGEVMHTCADTAALRALGWAPAVDLAAGIEQLIASENKK